MEVKSMLKVLKSYGASDKEAEELLIYNNNFFNHVTYSEIDEFPLTDEPFVSLWHGYSQKAKETDLFKVLQEVLIQLNFPIQEGISRTNNYRAATLMGKAVAEIPEASGLKLFCPENLELLILQTPAGKIPILLTGNRKDFEMLIQAFCFHNEPQTVPSSMGACMIKGYNNWDRIRAYHEQWEEKNLNGSAHCSWSDEFKRIIPHKELYQDRFMILTKGEYSGIPADYLGLPNDKWLELSLLLRCEHEAAHYFTERVLGSARNYILDEIIADYMGIVAANGSYRADWFLTFMGLENYPEYRQGGRLENYMGTPPLSNGAFKILQRLVKNAADNLERLTNKYQIRGNSANEKAKVLLDISQYSLIDLSEGLF